jgi:hypothetical protein
MSSRVSTLPLHVALGLSLALALAASPSAAHPLTPALLELRQTSRADVAVTWVQPQREGGSPRPRLPEGCEAASAETFTRDGDTWRVTWRARCESGLEGGVLAIDGLTPGAAPALARIVHLDGSNEQRLLTADASRAVIRGAAGVSAAGVARRFLLLGAEHLVVGADHLAFLLGLFLIVRRARALLAAVTAFTLGHSVTLALAALGVFPVPLAFVEVGIAASILAVAVELARRPGQGEPSGLWRRPWLVSLGFGLLHGAGFAVALRAAGLPRGELALALASFNLGIEVAQIAVLLSLAGAALLYRRLASPAPRWLERLPAEALGAVASFWLLQRGAALL